MRMSEMGTQLGELVVFMARQLWRQTVDAVDGDADSTFTNQLAMYGWLVREHVREALPPSEANTVLSAMHQLIFAQTEDAWESWTEFKRYTSNRRKGLDAAKADTNGEPMTHIVNYFVACCSDHWSEVAYDEIAPDPDDLELINDLLIDPTLIDRLRSRQAADDLPIYSLVNSMMQSVEIGSQLAALTKQVQARLNHI